MRIFNRFISFVSPSNEPEGKKNAQAQDGVSYSTFAKHVFEGLENLDETAIQKRFIVVQEKLKAKPLFPRIAHYFAETSARKEVMAELERKMSGGLEIFKESKAISSYLLDDAIHYLEKALILGITSDQYNRYIDRAEMDLDLLQKQNKDVHDPEKIKQVRSLAAKRPVDFTIRRWKSDLLPSKVDKIFPLSQKPARALVSLDKKETLEERIKKIEAFSYFSGGKEEVDKWMEQAEKATLKECNKLLEYSKYLKWDHLLLSRFEKKLTFLINEKKLNANPENQEAREAARAFIDELRLEELQELQLGKRNPEIMSYIQDRLNPLREASANAVEGFSTHHYSIGLTAETTPQEIKVSHQYVQEALSLNQTKDKAASLDEDLKKIGQRDIAIEIEGKTIDRKKVEQDLRNPQEQKKISAWIENWVVENPSGLSGLFLASLNEWRRDPQNKPIPPLLIEARYKSQIVSGLGLSLDETCAVFSLLCQGKDVVVKDLSQRGYTVVSDASKENFTLKKQGGEVVVQEMIEADLHSSYVTCMVRAQKALEEISSIGRYMIFVTHNLKKGESTIELKLEEKNPLYNEWNEQVLKSWKIRNEKELSDGHTTDESRSASPMTSEDEE